MTDEFRYLLFDMKTFTPTAELSEVGDPYYDEAINASGSAQVTIPFNPSLGFADSTIEYGFGYQDIHMPRAGLAIERNGTLVFAGPILMQTFNFATGALDLTANGIYEIMKRRICSTNHHFVPATALSPWVPTAFVGIGWDQAWIVKHYIDKMQEQPNGYLNIVNEHQTTGTYRVHQSLATDVKTFYDIIQDRANLIDGFDFKFTPRWKNGIRNEEIEWIFEIFYPPEGRDTELVFELGSNVDFSNMVVNGTEIAFGAYSIMESAGDIARVAFDESPSARAADYRLEIVDREHTDVKSVNTALLYAAMARSKKMKQSSIPSIIAPIELSNEFIIGDQVTIRAVWGLARLNERFRIMTFKVMPKPGIVEIAVAPLSNTGRTS